MLCLITVLFWKLCTPHVPSDPTQVCLVSLPFEPFLHACVLVQLPYLATIRLSLTGTSNIDYVSLICSLLMITKSGFSDADTLAVWLRNLVPRLSGMTVTRCSITLSQWTLIAGMLAWHTSRQCSCVLMLHMQPLHQVSATEPPYLLLWFATGSRWALMAHP